MKQSVADLLATLSNEDKRELFGALRAEMPIHPLEAGWHTSAEIILDAIAQSGDLTQRGVRGVIADRSFHRLVVPQLESVGWASTPILGDQAYDAHLTRGNLNVTVQVKMQRREKGVPKMRVIRGTPHWIVEVQRTRSGTNADGTSTRPYSFGSFDILAVNLYASSQNWSSYRYTVGRWLVPKRGHPHLIETMQPVSQMPNGDWTDNFEECADWLASGTAKTIAS
jgi:hypothetical protein